METFVDYCKDYILDNIDNFEGTTHYACDFCMAITEGPNIDGSLTYSRAKAKEYLNEWNDECADYWEFEKNNFGQNFHNPFDNPEAYMVCMVIEGCNSILSRCPYIEKHWNDQIELTAKVIKQIKKFVKDYDNERLF